MRVLLIGNYVNDRQESMQRFADFLADGLRRAGHQVRLLKPPAVVGRLWRSWGGVGKWLGYVDKFGGFPLLLRSAVRHADVVHICDHSNAIYVKYLKSVPNLVTCHDLLAVRSALGEFPQHPTRWTGRRLQSLILNGLIEAQHVACVSNATLNDLLRVAGIGGHRVSRVYNSLNYPYSHMEMTEAEVRLRKLCLDPREPFLLHVGGNQWYKNRLGVLHIFAQLRKLVMPDMLKLVMVGKAWTDEMRRFVAGNGLADVTLELTSVADEDLRALYSTATLMLFPSLEEGFGWPIVEAQACRCAVATSNRSPMDEVAGDGAVYVDPENPSLAAATLKAALDKLPGIREASLRNAARFRSGMIEGYIALYEKVCNDKCYA